MVMSEKKVGEVKELTEQELIVKAQKLQNEKINKASEAIKKILMENNLLMEVEHVIKLVPNRK